MGAHLKHRPSSRTSLLLLPLLITMHASPGKSIIAIEGLSLGQDHSFDHQQHQYFRDTQLFTSLVPKLFQTLPLPHNSMSPEIIPATVQPFNKLSTFAMIVSYNGLSFSGGYEHNPNLSPVHQPTVRGTLTQRMVLAMNRKSKLHIATAGRTDAYVSAKAALFSFRTATTVLKDTDDLNELRNQLNKESLNNDINVHSIFCVSSSFHATFSTKSREYIYVLPFRNSSDNIAYNTILSYVADTLLSTLQNSPLDYFAFSSRKVKTATTMCTIQQAGCWFYNTAGSCVYYSACADKNETEEVVEGFGDAWGKIIQQQNEECGCFVFKLKSDRFLRRMIRKLINALLQETSDVLSDYYDNSNNGIYLKDARFCTAKVDEWKYKLIQRLEMNDRSNNPPAPPYGLFLWKVEV